jgi:hypothetical protein
MERKREVIVFNISRLKEPTRTSMNLYPREGMENMRRPIPIAAETLMPRAMRERAAETDAMKNSTNDETPHLQLA